MRAHRRPVLAMALLGLLLVRAGAARAEGAPDWSRAFAPATIEPYLPSAKTDFILVAAGPVTPELGAAAAALERGLRASQRAGRVNRAFPGNTAQDLDDRAIFDRCQRASGATVVIVRMVPDAPPTASVTLLDGQGRIQTRFTQTATGEGAASLPWSADPPSGNDRYDREHLGLLEEGSGTSRSFAPCQGRWQRRLDPPELYRLVGRPDLADRYEHDRSARSGFLTAGLLLMAGGLGYATYQLSHDTSSADGFVAGVGVFGLGGLLTILGVTTHPSFDVPQARRLIDRHNAGLKNLLKVPPAGGSATLPSRPRWLLAPYAARSGGGLAAAGRF